MQQTAEQWYMVSGIAVHRRAARKVLQMATLPEDAQQRALAAVGGGQWEDAPLVTAPIVAPQETVQEVSES